MPKQARKAPAATMRHMGQDHVGSALLARNLPLISRSMTFAKMLRANISSLPNFKDLHWLFPPLCHRKDQTALTDVEKSRYICAFNMINSDGTLGQLVDIHQEMHMQHSNARLLPWHRVFLYLFEEALHNYHPDVCVPYWDWTRPEEQHFPDWLAGILPTVHTPTRTINVIRSPGSDGGLASIVAGVPTAMSRTNYNDFSSPINGDAKASKHLALFLRVLRGIRGIVQASFGSRRGLGSSSVVAPDRPA